jgi:predicted TPR repeat methyltransferase
MTKPGRNDPCSCGSGKKYKKCCGLNESTMVAPLLDINRQMEIAQRYHQHGDFAQAQAIYNQVLTAQPRNAVVLNLLGLAANQMGKDAEAARYYERAISAKPDFFVAFNNLGSTYKRLGRLSDAIKQYKRAEALEPESADVQFNLGSAYFALNDHDSSIAYLRNVVKLRPDHVVAHYNLATLLVERGNVDEAKAHLQQVLNIDPQNEEARHVMNALEHKNTERAPVAFVRRLFDLYADAFDQHLVGKLEYQIPEILVAEIQSFIGAEVKELEVLDLGCGTGLFGVAISAKSKRIIGIDLAPRMVTKAQARGVYSEVLQNDLLPYLQNAAAEQFDVVAAADVFIYFGNLSAIFQHVYRVLRHSGLFAFSVEGDSEQQEDFVLKETGRYRHCDRYIQRLSTESGFELKTIKPVSIRKQGDQPTAGFIVLLGKTT